MDFSNFCIGSYEEYLVSELRKQKPVPFEFSRIWAKNNFPKKAGVYLIWEDNNIIYAGETDNLQRRMRNIKSTRNHTFRRTYGEIHFHTHSDYNKASSKLRYSDSIEMLLNERISKKLSVSYLVIPFGRKEIEVRFHGKYNKRVKTS